MAKQTTRLALICSVALCAGMTGLASHGLAQGKGKGKPPKGKNGAAVAAVGEPAGLSLRFGVDERRVIHEYYRSRLQQLPPGLQKKVARGGTLPPGWQKKVQPFPVELEGHLPPLAAGYRRVVSGRVAMLIYDATNTVLDILDLTR